MGLRQYLIKKIVVYALTFFVAVSLDWAIPRFMPGSPIYALISRFASMPGAAKYLYSYFMQAFGLNKPLWQQYIDFWIAVLHGDLGISIYMYPEKVLNIIASALPYDIALLVPSITLSWIIGNWLGAIAAKKRRLDNTLMPVLYFLTSSPYFWLAIVLAWIFTVVIPLFPPSGAYSPGMVPSLSLSFIKDFLWHWFLPFLSLFLVMLGGWAIGMRNLIIYELESDYAKYMEALGAPDNLILRYAFKHAILPQVTGLALQFGLMVSGALVTEIVFSYPGIGYILLQAILNEDYFLIQGCFLIIVLSVLVANFVIDIVYAFIDPRIRYAYTGEVA